MAIIHSQVHCSKAFSGSYYPWLPLQARCEWDLSPAAESFLSSAVFGGMLLGAGAWGAYADYAGRK